MGKTKYNVYMESEGGARYRLATFEDYEEAVKFCEVQNYCYTDENGYEWDLDVVETND